MTAPIDDDVRALLAERIVDYERLEILLFLRRERSSLDVGAVATGVGLGSEATRRALTALERDGLLSVTAPPSERYRFEPKTPALADAVARLSQTYDERRVELVTLMSQISIDRLRTSTMRTFADAFLIGRKKKDG